MQFLSVCPRNMKGFQNPRHFPLQPIMGACPTNKPSQPQQAFWSMFCRSDGSSGCGLLAGATSAMATPRLVAVRGTSLWQPPGSWMLILTHLISSHPAYQPPSSCGAGGTRGQSHAHLWVRSSWVSACMWQLGTQSSSPGTWKCTAGH